MLYTVQLSDTTEVPATPHTTGVYFFTFEENEFRSIELVALAMAKVVLETALATVGTLDHYAVYQFELIRPIHCPYHAVLSKRAYVEVSELPAMIVRYLRAEFYGTYVDRTCECQTALTSSINLNSFVKHHASRGGFILIGKFSKRADPRPFLAYVNDYNSKKEYSFSTHSLMHMIWMAKIRLSKDPNAASITVPNMFSGIDMLLVNKKISTL